MVYRAKQEPILRVENEAQNHEIASKNKQEPSLRVEKEAQNHENASNAKEEEMQGVSMLELFTPQQVRDHIQSLRKWSKAKAEENQAILMNENSCQLCAIEKLTFAPLPIYCTPCGARIKRNAVYYTVDDAEVKYCICVQCFHKARGSAIDVEGQNIDKPLQKKMNDEETEEWWVQCDKCGSWQHQICALFNTCRNDDDQAKYTCPNCYIEEVERGECKPLPQSAIPDAKDLPCTILSKYIENRLLKRLKEERQDRANYLGKSFDEVAGAERLVVRVVSSVDKKLNVNPRFLEILEEDYPTDFPYKSKAILLFQEIEGVDVCLFGMYVQEFGTECALPNQRRVYLSHLDSVKYFRPEIKTVSGQALRTFVYHEILIGYLEYCKMRGFTSCYIWACPPFKDEDYILYCHPEIQKTPKPDRLRQWYLSMLKKGVRENIVVHVTNLYDHFFTHQGECREKLKVARLPYFGSDYWPGAADDIITQLLQEENDHKQRKKGKMKKARISKRSLKAAGHTDLSGKAFKDAKLIQKLAVLIYPMREDFIIAHLQHPCNHCCILMVSGIRWVCKTCRYFNLCDSCHNAELLRKNRERHPTDRRGKHSFKPMLITGVPHDTKDKDDILESEFFDTPQAFLSLCQRNHYQYDTLRRAKHSSMMVLYHLHNPIAPALVTTCNVCAHDIGAGQGWRCEVCLDFDVCNTCYQKEGVINHPYKLTNHPSNSDRDAQNKEAGQKQLKNMLELVVHESQCRSPHCQYPNCLKLKEVFCHGMRCQIRASGGCSLCQNIRSILQLHAHACKETNCTVPCCKNLKEHLMRLQQQSELRRRAVVNEMMRQRDT